MVGRSLGTTVATFVARGRPVRGMILIQPLLNARPQIRHHGPDILAWLGGSAFDNLERMPHVTCPVLVIHGSADNVIPPASGRKVYEACTARKRFVLVKGANHESLDPLNSREARTAIERVLAREETYTE